MVITASGERAVLDMAQDLITRTLVAERAKAAGVTKVVYDRGGFLYHGRIKALTDAAREAGLNKDELAAAATEEPEQIEQPEEKPRKKSKEKK